MALMNERTEDAKYFQECAGNVDDECRFRKYRQ